MRPSQILSHLCKREGWPSPVYEEGSCKVGGKKFTSANPFYKDGRGLQGRFEMIFTMQMI